MHPVKLVVYNHEHRPFLVKLVYKGDRYGLGRHLVHDKDDPLVELYDLSQDPGKFGPDGQHVQAYYRSTLLERERGLGLTLVGHVPAWTLDVSAMTQIIRWLEVTR